MKDLVIDRAEVFAVGPPTERHAWALEMEDQCMSHTVLRVTTRGGLVGIAGAAAYSGHGFDLSVGETLRTMLPDLLGCSALEPEAIARAFHSLILPRAPQAQSLIDVAVWDILAKAAGLPLFRLLGGYRDSIPAYASTAMLPSKEAYVDLVAELAAQGFAAIKFHCWCELSRDLAMVEAVAARYGTGGPAFMLDVEQRYDRRAARRMGEALDELGFRWFEAPLDDFDVTGYADLTARLSIPVLPGGNSITDPRLIARCIEDECWGAVRVDVMSCGGITPARRIAALAAAHGLDVELQCWGYSLAQAANLHLMCAIPNTTYFEQPWPYSAFEHGARNPIRTGKDGLVRPPGEAGLGIELDWDAIEQATLLRFESRLGG
jgi:L-alanine-DL-glutamate epimerase-like enolase superfamily enzyme